MLGRLINPGVSGPDSGTETFRLNLGGSEAVAALFELAARRHYSPCSIPSLKKNARLRIAASFNSLDQLSTSM